MNRRMALLAAGAIALAGAGVFAALELGGSDGRVTLKSRILDYEKSLQTMRSRPSPEEIGAHVAAMMGEYFRLGMSNEEVVKILGENDLAIDDTAFNEVDSRFDGTVYYDVSISALIPIPTWNPLILFNYMFFRVQKR